MLCNPTKVAAASCQALLPEFNHSGDGSSMSFLLRQIASDRLNFEEHVAFAFCLATLARGETLIKVLVRRSRSSAPAKDAPPSTIRFIADVLDDGRYDNEFQIADSKFKPPRAPSDRARRGARLMDL